VPATLLDAVHRRGPVTLRGLSWDTEPRERRDVSCTNRTPQVARRSARKEDHISTVPCPTALLLSFFHPVQLIFLGKPDP